MSKKISYARVFTIQPSICGGNLVCVEADVSKNLFSYSVVGLADTNVKESSERIHGALKNNNLKTPKQGDLKTTISLSPSDIKKVGSHYDVPIAVAFLSALEGFMVDEHIVMCGELNLSGEILPIKGILSFAYTSIKEGKTTLYVPQSHVHVLSVFSELKIYGFSHITQLIAHIKEEEMVLVSESILANDHDMPINFEIGDIVGQDHALRSSLIAVIGQHNCSFYGPPGTGKTMLARALYDLLPPLTQTQALETYEMHSYSSENPETLMTRAPLRAPHHTSSYVAMLGGGTLVRPGEISLAHNGMLFMDEFPEFETRVLESLRQPLEDKYITISRAKQSIQLPARFLLVCAMNPCPCGFRFSEHKACTCTQMQLLKYRKKLSGPIMDRIDMWIPVLHIPLRTIDDNASKKLTKEYRDKVTQAREKINKRSFELFKKYIPNSELSLKHLQEISINPDAKSLLISSCEKLELSPRVFLKIYKLALTISDIEGSEIIEKHHILEALQQRKPPHL